jgi:hypothetical protein
VRGTNRRIQDHIHDPLSRDGYFLANAKEPSISRFNCIESRCDPLMRISHFENFARQKLLDAI